MPSSSTGSRLYGISMDVLSIVYRPYLHVPTGEWNGFLRAIAGKHISSC